MEKTELLQKKLGSIQRGVYWFGIFGRLSYIVGMLYTIVFIVVLASGITHNFAGSGWRTNGWQIYAFNGMEFLVLGYLFLIVRDAFEAIEGLICEIGEII
ncbi:MAG: hypothetical protein PHP45_06650 [Elusimicrobiales bacterium]|nr:hypothetical protein [Elusimicrobiales bacterium]